MEPRTSCCAEGARAGLDRRRFLAGAAGAGAASVVTTLFGDAVRQVSYGATRGGNVLVVLSLRGGVDGLGTVVPHADPAYARARPTLAVPTASLVCADAQFGLHPALAPLRWAWDAGLLAAVHAVGLPVPNRSHFSAMEAIEDADPTSRLRRGWVNRMVGLDVGGDALEAVHLGSSMAPTAIAGPAPHVAATRLDAVSLVGADGSSQAGRERQLGTVWKDVGGPLGAAARATVQTVRRAGAVAAQEHRPRNGAVYPTAWPARDLGRALADTAKLVRADLGTEVVSIDFGDFDLHADYGGGGRGAMATLLGAVAESLSAFLTDLRDLGDRVTVVTMSEFGRRVAENGARGLDHGWGNAVLLAGGGVRGGRYHGRWPGLGSGQQVDGDLAVTTDHRDLLGEVVAHRFPDRPIGKVFPGHTYRPIGVMRPT